PAECGAPPRDGRGQPAGRYAGAGRWRLRARRPARRPALDRGGPALLAPRRVALAEADVGAVQRLLFRRPAGSAPGGEAPADPELAVMAQMNGIDELAVAHDRRPDPPAPSARRSRRRGF